MAVDIEKMRAEIVIESQKCVVQQALGVWATCIATAIGLTVLVLYMMGKL